MKNLFLTYYEITVHKFWVLLYVLRVCFCLVKRAIKHDLSKYSGVEAPVFAKNISELKSVKHGSPEYAEILKKLGPVLKHHYSTNRHHPDFFVFGIKDMSPIDIKKQNALEFVLVLHENLSNCSRRD